MAANQSNINKTVSERSIMLYEIVSILYQVNDLALAMDMILDTIGENFKLQDIGIAVVDDIFEQYRIIGKRGFKDLFSEEFTISTAETINEIEIKSEEKTQIPVVEQHLKIGGRTVKTDPNLRQLLFFPVRYHEKLIGFIILGSDSSEPFLSHEDEQVITMFSTLIGPVLFTFDPVKKASNTFENIISKIIKDRVYEARLVLNPISFAVFRLVFQESLTDSLIFEDAVQNYQREFNKVLSEKGDLIWLTADTAFFIYSGAGLFEVEALAGELKENLKNICRVDEKLPLLTLKYTCISYPQSGDNAVDIIRSLWMKLFEEIYLMKE